MADQHNSIATDPPVERGVLCLSCPAIAGCLAKQKNVALCRERAERRIRTHLSLVKWDLITKLWLMLFAITGVGICMVVFMVIFGDDFK